MSRTRIVTRFRQSCTFVLAGGAACCALVFVIAGLSGCKREAAAPEPSKATRPNVLLITLDTTRADRLGCYGYEKAHTPTLDRLAARGVVFENAYCQVPLTLPSHVTLMTGLYPPSHGIRINGISAVSPKVATLAEAFQATGYKTAAFVSAYVLDSAFGLDQGFDHYDDRMVAASNDPDLSSERPAGHVTDAALDWFDKAGDGPFFAWVHYFDPHDPYEPPAEFLQKCDNPYDGEIAYADAQINRLLAWLDGADRTDNTIVVVVGDHGEAFGEHGERSHGLFVYNPTIHVPLIVAFPKVVQENVRIQGLVGVVDLAATLADLAGVDGPPLMDGNSLAGHCRTGQGSFGPIYVESEYPRLSFGWAPLYSVLHEKWKYVAAPQPELYDLATDAGELKNLVEIESAAAGEMLAELTAVMEGMHREAGGTVAASGSSTELLESLGYVGAGPDATDGRPLRDPKEMVDVYVTAISAKNLLQHGRPGDAAEMIQPMIAQSPDAGVLLATLAEAYLNLNRFPEAEAQYRAALKHQPADATTLCGLGDALRGQGKSDEAIDAYNRALAITPDFGQAHSRLGLVYARMGDHQKAHAHFARFAELNPASPNALSNLGNALMALKRPADAVKQLRAALEIDAGYAPAHHALWQALNAAGQGSDALAALRRAVEVLPNDAVSVRSLAAVVTTQAGSGRGDVQEALRLGHRACELDAGAESYEVLARAQAVEGDFPAAIQSAETALQKAIEQAKQPLVDRMRRALDEYRSKEAHLP